MTTLLIKDLAVATDLDAAEMASVTGGYYKTPSCGIPTYPAPEYKPERYKAHPTSFSFDASQSIAQSQNVVNNNGNCVAYADCIDSTVNPTQSGHNNINF